jgi:tRNA/rRNA methyltransferase
VSAADPRAQIVVVLYCPQDVRNIGAVVRAMKNMGVQRLRLVRPVAFDPQDLLGLAHRSDDLVAAIQYYADLDAALADLHYVVGTSEHWHAERPMQGDVRAWATEALALAQTGGVGLLFGPEDNGLRHAEFDRCHTIVRLPTDPAYPSLNIAQAALLLLYELQMALPQRPPPLPTRAAAAELEQTMILVEAALHRLAFIKAGDGSKLVRTLRGLLYRVQPDDREVALLRALARAVIAGRMRDEG